jgi:hypothetical protein
MYRWEDKKQYFQRLKSGAFEHTYERVIHYLMNNGYAAKVKQVSDALSIPRNTLLYVHVNRCEYLVYDKQHQLISLNRKGKTLGDLGIDTEFPEDNTNIFNFVTALLVNSGMDENGVFGLTFKNSIPNVQQFCRDKGIPFGTYDIDQNTVFEQCKKIARKFRKEGELRCKIS